MSDMDICWVVRQTLESRGIRMTWLAEQSGIPYKRLQRQVTGKTKFTAAEWEKVKKVLGI